MSVSSDVGTPRADESVLGIRGPSLRQRAAGTLYFEPGGVSFRDLDATVPTPFSTPRALLSRKSRCHQHCWVHFAFRDRPTSNDAVSRAAFGLATQIDLPHGVE